MSAIKIIVEEHSDGYVAYMVGLDGIVVGEGASYDEALADVKSAMHVETFGEGLNEDDALEACIVTANVRAV